MIEPKPPGPPGLVEVRLHGRGGHGTVIASKMLARAAMTEGRSVQCFPDFGVERRGAPVTAFLRISDAPIRRRSKVYRPKHLLVMERQLLPLVDLSTGGDGIVLVNTIAAPEELEIPAPWHAVAVDATGIAKKHGLARGAIPVLNSPMAAAFARATGLAGFDAVLAAVRDSVPVAVEENVAAAREAWDAVRFPAVESVEGAK